MASIEVLGSGSKGNCYIISCGNGEEKLILDAGVQIKDVLKALKFNLRSVNACLVSHCHADHLKYGEQFLKRGLSVYMASNPSLNYSGIQIIQRMKNERFGAYTVTAFKVPHNETECDGFYIRHPEIGKLIFITDAEMCPYNFGDLAVNHVMVECNYSVDYLQLDSANKAHVLRGHMELQTCKRFLKSIYTKELKTIGLLHLSAENADPERFQKEIQDEFPDVFVWVAHKGYALEI